MSENNDFGMKLKSYRKAREMSQADSLYNEEITIQQLLHKTIFSNPFS